MMYVTNVYIVATITVAREIAQALREVGFHGCSTFQHNRPVVITDAEWGDIESVLNLNNAGRYIAPFADTPRI